MSSTNLEQMFIADTPSLRLNRSRILDFGLFVVRLADFISSSSSDTDREDGSFGPEILKPAQWLTTPFRRDKHINNPVPRLLDCLNLYLASSWSVPRPHIPSQPRGRASSTDHQFDVVLYAILQTRAMRENRSTDLPTRVDNVLGSLDIDLGVFSASEQRLHTSSRSLAAASHLSTGQRARTLLGILTSLDYWGSVIELGFVDAAAFPAVSEISAHLLCLKIQRCCTGPPSGVVPLKHDLPFYHLKTQFDSHGKFGTTSRNNRRHPFRNLVFKHAFTRENTPLARYTSSQQSSSNISAPSPIPKPPSSTATFFPNSTRSITCQPDLDSSTSNPATEMYMTLCKQRNFFGLHTCFPNVQKLNLRLSRQQTCYIKLVHGVKQVVHTEICFHMDSSSRLTTIRTTWSIVMGYDMGYLSNLPEDFDRERWHADNVDDWLRLMFPFTLIGIQTALTHYPSAGDTVGVVHDEDHTIHYHYERYDP
ncbi:uncharacterized protein ARMOST_16393 [Armillaria ostoyae]|uniref:Uncharacterized protein n=1 Tax=Armillaria ostoyae TaxID=47428 RepID=A0A284RW15_ARMOS|nr:uncharacterized protein ARMOST_16393 [Armillaria ostoyae]